MPQQQVLQRGVGVTKGSVIYYDNPNFVQTFMCNPSKISDKKGSNFAKTAVPHISHPIYQYGAGGERVISFTLQHCGDRFRATGSRQRIPNDPGLGVEDYLRFWRSLTYPAGANSLQDATTDAFVTARGPRKVLFNFGPMWQNVVCYCTRADIEAVMFTHDLQVMKADVAVELEEVPDSPQFASDVRNGTQSVVV